MGESWNKLVTKLNYSSKDWPILIVISIAFIGV